jgi:hypothetical protein
MKSKPILGEAIQGDNLDLGKILLWRSAFLPKLKFLKKSSRQLEVIFILCFFHFLDPFTFLDITYAGARNKIHTYNTLQNLLKKSETPFT